MKLTNWNWNAFTLIFLLSALAIDIHFPSDNMKDFGVHILTTAIPLALFVAWMSRDKS